MRSAWRCGRVGVSARGNRRSGDAAERALVMARWRSPLRCGSDCWPWRGSRRGRGGVCWVWVALMVLAVLAAVLGAVADSVEAQAGGSFDDDDGSVHEPALEALASRGVFGGMGCGERLICPDVPLKRWEMAVWLVRALDGRDPEPSGVSRFADVDSSEWYSPFIERLLDLRVTNGCAVEPLRFCPRDVVSRAQMATLLVRAFDLESASSGWFRRCHRWRFISRGQHRRAGRGRRHRGLQP